MKLRNSLLWLGAVAGLFATATATATDADPPSPALLVQVTRLGISTTHFGCGAVNKGPCNYLILTSLCQEKLDDNGVKERTCRYSAPVPPFQLAPGDKKTVTNLPADYMSLMKIGSVPTPEEVLRAAQAH